MYLLSKQCGCPESNVFPAGLLTSLFNVHMNPELAVYHGLPGDVIPNETWFISGGSESRRRGKRVSRWLQCCPVLAFFHISDLCLLLHTWHIPRTTQEWWTRQKLCKSGANILYSHTIARGKRIAQKSTFVLLFFSKATSSLNLRHNAHRLALPLLIGTVPFTS